MPGKIVTLHTSSVFNCVWPRWSMTKLPTQRGPTYSIKKDAKCWTKTRWHTYVMIFSVINPEQRKMLELLKEWDRVDILYESVPAVNKTPGHGEAPRNVLVIFELKSVPKQVQNSAVPQVR